MRSWNMATQLARRGWDVTVVTPTPEQWRFKEDRRNKVITDAADVGVRLQHVRVPWPMLSHDLLWQEGFLGRLVCGLCRRVVRHLQIDATIGWMRAVNSLGRTLTSGHFDLLLSTGGPFTSFRLAEPLARRLGCPYVLDYRDPWTGNPHLHCRDREREWECRLLHGAAAVTVVSPSWAEMIGSRFGVESKTYTLWNGYDADMFRSVERREFDHFAVVYAGTLYPPQRVVDPVLRAIGALGARCSPLPVRFHYYGTHSRLVRQTAERLGMEAVVNAHGLVSRKEALEAQKGASLNVVIASVQETGGAAENGIVTGKIFDCLALGSPLLVIAPSNNDLRQVISQTGGGECYHGGESDGIAAFIRRVAMGHKPSLRDAGGFQWASLGERLAGILEAAAGKGAGPRN